MESKGMNKKASEQRMLKLKVKSRRGEECGSW